MFVFAGLATAFWLLQLGVQYYWLTTGDAEAALLRSFALTGATLIGLALFSSALFKWVPRLAKHWRTRRHLGVSGAVFITFHVLWAYGVYYDFSLRSIYYSFNPLENPIIFGSIAYPILLVMALISSDWAMQKVTPKRWKFIHRFVYLAYWGAIFHFITINPAILLNPPGILLLLITCAAVFGQIFWYVRTVRQRGWKKLGSWVGLGFTLLFTVTAYMVFRPQTAPTPTLEESIEELGAFMGAQPTDPNLQTTPVIGDQAFTASMLRKGTFQKLHYTTVGTASLEKNADGLYFVIFANDFSTPNGPDLRVYVTKNSGPTQREDVPAGINLGKLKSTTGKQVYALPPGTDVQSYLSITIHCEAFNVPWSYAPFE